MNTKLKIIWTVSTVVCIVAVASMFLSRHIHRDWHGIKRTDDGVIRQDGYKIGSKVVCHGQTTCEFSDGGKAIMNYEHGMTHGVQQFFYPNGKLKVENTNHYGPFCGIRREFDEEGKLKYECEYVIRHVNGRAKSVSIDELLKEKLKAQQEGGPTDNP